MARGLGWAVGLVLLLSGANLRAEDIGFDVAVDQTKLGVQDHLTLTLTVTGTGIKKLAPPALPELKGFSVISGPSISTSTSMSLANGRMTQSQTHAFTYVLRPTQTGRFPIGPLTLKYGGKRYSSAPVVVEVVPGSTAQARPVPGTAPGAYPAESIDLQGNLYVTGTPDKSQAYVGEQVVVTYKLYTRVEIGDVGYQSVPSFAGFWSEPLYDAQRIQFGREVIGGKTFNVLHLKTVALFPTMPGEVTIDPLEVVCQVKTRSQSRGLFGFDDDFFFGGGKQLIVPSDPIKIKVLPLPAGAPPGFGGAVGSFAMSAQVDQAQVKQGDPVSASVTISGTGNVQNITQPALPGLSDCRVYDPEVTFTPQNAKTAVKGAKTFKYIIVPNAAGTHQIGPFAFSFFDPGSRTYKTLRTRVSSVNVTPRPQEEQPEAVVTYRLGQQDIEELGSDIRYIKPDMPALSNQGAAVYRSAAFLLLQMVPVLSVLGAVMLKRHRDRIQTDVAYVRRRKSKGEAARRLKHARKLLGDDDASAAFCAEVYRALSRFLADRLNVPSAGMTGESAAALLADRALDGEVVDRVREVFQQCDFARFAVTNLLASDRQRLFDLTEQSIELLEKQI